MSPPGGGRNSISNRLMRHFNIQGLQEPDFKNCFLIYSTIMNIYADLHYEAPDVNSQIKDAFNLTIEASIDFYNTICNTLKPTPSKSYYIFNLRNMTHIYQGMQMAPPSLFLRDIRLVYKLWIHEVTRVFYDRLQENDEDMIWFLNSLQLICRTRLRDEMKDLIFMNLKAPDMNQPFPKMIRHIVFMDLFQ
jgi:dynein heavy chain